MECASPPPPVRITEFPSLPPSLPHQQLKAEKAAKEAKAMRDSGIQMVDDGTDLTASSANPNRKNGADGEGQWASGIDAAIGSLSLKGGGSGGGGAEEKHPEKRMKAVSERVCVIAGGGWFGEDILGCVTSPSVAVVFQFCFVRPRDHVLHAAVGSSLAEHPRIRTNSLASFSALKTLCHLYKGSGVSMYDMT